MRTQPLGFGVGAMQPGVRLVATCTPVDVIPPPLWEKFKRAVIDQAKTWGLSVRFGEDDGSIAAAQQRFWEMTRVRATRPANGDE